MAPEGHAGAGGWRLGCRSEGRIRKFVRADEERAMSKGQSRWSRWTVVFAVAVGMSLVASAWAVDAKGKTQDATNAVAEVSAQGEIPAITARLQEVEAQLSKVEDRFEDYRRSQDNMLKEMLVQWSGLLIAPIREQFNENAQKEFETFRKQSQTILDSVSEKDDQKGQTGDKGKKGEVECWYKNAMLWVASIFSIIILVVFYFLYRLARKKQTIENSTLYCYELGLLVIIILLISIGSYHLLSRIIDLGTRESCLQSITAPEVNQAVIQAYEQLSNEMERWLALLSILGAFIGLVLPIGAYLLQIKTVNRQEEHLDKQIEKAVEDAKTEMKELVDKKVEALQKKSEEAQSMIDKSVEVADANVAVQVEQIWKANVSKHQLELAMAVRILQEQEENAFSAEEIATALTQWFFAIVFIIKSISHINDEGFLRSIIKDLRGLHNTILKNKDRKDELKKFVSVFLDFTDEIEDEVATLRKCFPDWMKQLEKFLSEFGIVFGEKSTHE